MELYKVILVDDEEEIRKGIIRRVKWEELGFTIVGEAENGLEALEVVEKTLPDLVIADIKMPFMDGMTLTKELHERFPTIKVIILSGFDDFEYAREALKLGVMRYILKPINGMEMNTLLREIKVILDEEILSKTNLHSLKNIYKKSLPLLKERFLSGWVEAHIALEDIQHNLYELNLEINSESLVAVVIHPDELHKREIKHALIKNKNILKLALFNICEEITAKEELGILFPRREDLILIVPLRKGENPKSSSRLFRGLEQIRQSIKKYLNTAITIGVGNICSDPTYLYKSYEAAVSALDYRITMGSNKIIYIDDIEPTSCTTTLLEAYDEHDFLTLIKLGQENHIPIAIDKMFSQLEGEYMTLREYQLHMVGLLANIIKLGGSMKVDWQDLLPPDTNFLEALSRLCTKEEMRQWLTQFCLSIAKQINTTRKASKNELIEKALSYIHSHYHEESLNAESVCNELHISTHYFSALFKKEMDITFSTYLTQIRIEKAKVLLQTTTQKASEIGCAVGYPEGHYFSFVFKKITGYAPTEYRNGKI